MQRGWGGWNGSEEGVIGGAGDVERGKFRHRRGLGSVGEGYAESYPPSRAWFLRLAPAI